MGYKKSRAFAFLRHVPVIRDTADPEYVGIFLLFMCVVVGALIAFGQSSSAYTKVLQTAGGVLVVLGVYFTVVNLRTSRVEQYVGRLIAAIGQLGSESKAVRLATIRLLEALVLEEPDVNVKDVERVARYKRAAIEALAAIARPDENTEVALAGEVSDAVASASSDNDLS
jgi:hypothetical protein